MPKQDDSYNDPDLRKAILKTLTHEEKQTILKSASADYFCLELCARLQYNGADKPFKPIPKKVKP